MGDLLFRDRLTQAPFEWLAVEFGLSTMRLAVVALLILSRIECRAPYPRPNGIVIHESLLTIETISLVLRGVLHNSACRG